MTGLYFYKLVSPYSDDITKDCKLTINEIDSNFLNLKNADIKSAAFDRDTKTLVLARNDGDTLLAKLDTVPYDLSVTTEEGDKGGVTLTINYDGEDGEKTITIENVLTSDNLSTVLGRSVLTKVITDGSLFGEGTFSSPLGIKNTEKTGYFAPVKTYIDLTASGSLPDDARKGDRYVTSENLSIYGYLYNWDAVQTIKAFLAEEGRGWRIPTKEDWDKLLNSIEPCEYRNHDSERCHAELGKLAGKYLKSECGWVGQEECTCLSVGGIGTIITVDTDNIGDITDPTGIDKYGFSIYPAGQAELTPVGDFRYEDYKEAATFWTDTHICNDENQDIYVKVFKCNRSGVVQEGDCPDKFYSLRLVKDFDGSNYYDSEEIAGQMYNTALSEATNQIWTTCNLYFTSGLIGPDEENSNYTFVNGGEVPVSKKVFFINEWNGVYWNKKLLKEGYTFVINHLIIDGQEYNDLEYRVFVNNECSFILRPTDDISSEHILSIIMPIIENEKNERIAKDNELEAAINAVTELANQTSESLAQLSAEYEAHVQEYEAHVQQNAEKFAEIDEAIAGLDEKIEAETVRATAEEDGIKARMLDTSVEYIFKADKENGGVIIPAVGGDDADALKIGFDGNFGEF